MRRRLLGLLLFHDYAAEGGAFSCSGNVMLVQLANHDDGNFTIHVRGRSSAAV